MDQTTFRAKDPHWVAMRVLDAMADQDSLVESLEDRVVPATPTVWWDGGGPNDGLWNTAAELEQLGRGYALK